MEKIQQELSSLTKSLNSLRMHSNFLIKLGKYRFSSKSKILDLLGEKNKAGDSQKEYNLRTTPIELQLTKRLYVTKVILTIESTLSKTINLTYFNNDSTYSLKSSSSVSARSSVSKVIFSINSAIDKFTISSASGTVTIVDFEIYGLADSLFPQSSGFALKNQVQKFAVTHERIKNTTKALRDYSEQLAQRESAFENRIGQLQIDIENLESEYDVAVRNADNAEHEFNEANEQLTEIQQSLAKEKAQLELSKDEVERLTVETDKLQERKRSLTNDTQILSKKLVELQQDKDVFSEDLKGYVAETRFQQAFYGFMVIVCLAIISTVTFNIFERSILLMEQFNTGELKYVWNLILSRIPYTLAIIALMGATGAFLQKAVSRLIEIHDQRLAFLRLSILARDITYVSTEDLDLTDLEKAQQRIRLKTQFIKQHMDKDIVTQTSSSEVESN
ncbi:hypothetical protein FR729_22350 [Vibrio alginolyticus]|uniref:hypothetical protein n=1 Tax=Vibrio alginolyticus TaxID=663 RepID=UPI0014282B04|nr:hypothetical protein [Vibrio alginolyticus]EJE1252281.1 hypothetical protein [Vibrio parahaemolyticus]EJE4735459.1 hypothetical protein [Vibrio parahaemolyticus]EKY4211277.1 hypothetical protein [Vibrio alginolyticus]MBE4250085.1 hypothetical protein [Vibrio parahaemolyticus]QIR95795.1 hypothetical protein FR729_22350 [Vibrio alginolyticus]